MTSPSSCGFMVLHSNQLEGLRDLLVEVVRRDPLPPLAPEVLLVQSNGMKHWLEIALAERLGICAATEIALPAAMLWQFYRRVLGPGRVRAQMPLDKAALVWRLMRCLPVLLTQAEFAPLARYLDASTNEAPNGLRLYQLAQQLADVLDGYQNYRADWLDDWAQGRDAWRDRHGQAQPLPEPQRWQAALWRHLLADLDGDDEPIALQSRAQVHEAFLDALRRAPEGQPLAGLPRRLIVFGVSALPMQTVEALAALGRVCQVLMFVHNPCQHYWGDVVESHAPLRQWARQRQAAKSAPPPRDADGGFDAAARYQLHTDSHPLLAAWGKQGRDYLHALDRFDDVARYRDRFQRVDVFVDPCEGRETPSQLEQLQSAVLRLEATPRPPRALAEDDDSLCFVQTHGAQREVEVLHDRILGWLDADASLRADDIMVMVPDMAAFAPHIHAVFGRFPTDDPRHLPYAVADQTARDEPLVQVLEQLLQLPQLRITQREWRRWFDVAPLRQRFGLDADDVDRAAAWLDEAGVRWGLDAAHRADWGLRDTQADAGQNSWLFGLERLLLGYAQGAAPHDAQDDIWRDVLALPALGGQDAACAQGLLTWLRAVEEANAWLRQMHTPAEWVRRLQGLVDAFFRARTDDETRLIERVLEPLTQWLAQCQLARLDTPLPLTVVREHWLAQLQQPALRRRFFGGGVQFATLLPMRTIPYRIVCLLGMNDADYPRRQTPRDFDLMTDARQWRPGDRARREDDRYLFLEALLSARERLYVSWQGKQTTDHQDLPPSVLVAQLLDHLGQGWTPGRTAALQPLQPFSARYFERGGPTTYAEDWQVARQTMNGEALATHEAFAIASTSANVGTSNVSTVSDASNVPGTFDHSAPTSITATSTASANITRPPETITLDQLKRLLRQPLTVYFRDRLGVTLHQPEAQTREDEPFALDPLDEYRLVGQIAQSDATDDALQRLRLGGELALGGFGQMQARRLAVKGEQLQEHGQACEADWPEPLPPQRHDFTFGDGLPALQAHWAHQPQPRWRQRDDGAWLQLQWRAGNVLQGEHPHQQARIDTLHELWLNHLAACASGHAATSVQIGLDAQLRLDPLPASAAHAHLRDLTELWLHAWRAPLPVPRRTACAWLLARHAQDGDAAEEAARQTFEGGFRREGEWAQEPALQRVLPDYDAVRPWLAAWAERLYGPLREAARVVHHTAREAA